MLKAADDGVLLFIKVIPKSSSNSIVGREGDRLKMKVTTVPEKGKANKAVIKLLSELLKISKSSFEIISGESSREKTLLIRGITTDDERWNNIV